MKYKRFILSYHLHITLPQLVKVVVKKFHTTIKKRKLEGKLPSKPFKVPLEMDNPFQWVCRPPTFIVFRLQHM